MSNFYKDNNSILFHLKNPDMEKVVRLKEDDYSKAAESDYAPYNFEDAMENYDGVLDIVGSICSDIIAPNAESVDKEGPRLENNRVHYASKTKENMEALANANLMGMTLPRKYGGLNFPTTVYCGAIEMISRADASLMNLFGLQDIGETVKEFATDDIKEKYLPQFSSGEATGAMILTEPDAGSDLQAVNLKASLGEDGVWRLNGVKRFITNGNAELSLVLARTEAGTTDGRGLSMFLYERDETVTVRRIETKLGIHGSPTCELVFSNSPVILIGKRKFGLIKYVMALMNGARLGVSCQSIGIGEACYREAVKYANERKQFGKAINRFPAVYEMLTNMKVKIEAARTLLYETARFVDIYKSYEDLALSRKLTAEEKKEMKKYQRRANFYTPLLKGISSEYANQIAYDAIQIHGGTGYMNDFAVERLYRDARITSIYEGTTQLQVVAAIKGVTSGSFYELMNEYSEYDFNRDQDFLKDTLNKQKELYQETVAFIDGLNDLELLDFHARRLTEIAGNIIMGYLLLKDAKRSDDFKVIAELFIKNAVAENTQKMEAIRMQGGEEISLYKKYI